jgi:Threonine aldolase
MYSFKNDYTATAHPRLLRALGETSLEQDEGYGLDRHSLAAAEHIREHLGPSGQNADIHFLCGGTQTNMVALAAFLRPHEAVIAPDTAHICVHETGAIEATGHKIIAVPSCQGKLLPEHVREALDAHCDEHMVKPRLIKITNATELGTLYTLDELEALSALCRSHNLLLYIDGARLGYALTAEGNDVTLGDLCRLTDAFYIGGTKNGALLGEALVLCNDALKADFRYHIKQRGAMLAKGRVLGVQFEELFRDGLYFDLARHGNSMAQTICSGLRAMGHAFLTDSPSNQIFPILPNALIQRLEKDWMFYVWQSISEEHSAIRLVADWSTEAGAVDRFLDACR